MRINPILRNEMKTDSRRFRFYLLLMIYTGLLGIPTLLFYGAVYGEYRITASHFSNMYIFVACMQACILMFIVPALTATCITGEREKQTLDILLTTQMSPGNIIIGKLLGAVSKVFLMIICTMPVYAIVLFLGGIKFSFIVAINLYLMMTTIFVAALSIWVSTMVKTSMYANVAAYFLELGLIIGYPVILMILTALGNNHYELDGSGFIDFLMNILCISPAVGYGHLIGSQLGNSHFLYDYLGSQTKMLMPGWLISVLAEGALTILFITAAIKRLNPRKKKYFRKKG